MGAKEYSIAFMIAGKLSGAFSNTFKKANDTVGAFNKQVNTLNRESAQVDGLVKMRQKLNENARACIDAMNKHKGVTNNARELDQKTAELSRQYDSARRRLSAYSSQINRSTNVSDELINKYEQQEQKVAELGRALKAAQKDQASFQRVVASSKKELDRAKAAVDKQRTAVRELDSSLGTAGQTLQQLTRRQNELARAADKARVAQERLAKANALQSRLKDGGMNSQGVLLNMAAKGGATLGMPINEAMKLEDAMADIAKVANFDNPDGLKNLQKQLQKMSLRIPLAADGLAQIAAAAAQSGIASKDLAGFTEQAAMMAVAFGISADEAGNMMAKWKSGMGLTNEETYRLADAVNYLSNNNAALASEIGDTIKRYGALGKVAGLTAEQTAALSASVIGAGATSETAATGIKAMMRAMGSGGSMSDDQAAAFKNVGIDPKQLQKNLQKDAPQAIMSTLEAIQKKIPKEKWNQYLNAMFGDEAAVAIGPMMQNLHGLRVNFERVSDPAKYAGSMLGEFKARAATTSNALVLAGNTVKYFAQAVGAPLLDPLKEGATEFVKWGETIGDWVSNNKELVMSVMKVSGAVVGSIAGFHVLRMALAFTASPMISLYKGFLNMKRAVDWVRNSTMLASIATKSWGVVCKATTATVGLLKGALRMTGMALKGIGWLVSQGLMLAWRAACILTNGAIKALTIGVKLLGGALKFMFTNPIGLAITAIVGLVAAGVSLYQNWDTVKAKLVELWASFSEKFPGISAVLTTWWENAKSVFENVKGIFSNLIGFVKNVFTGQWSAAWENVKGIFANIFESLKTIAKAPINWIIEKINGLIGKINGIGSMNIPGFGKVGVNIPTIPMMAQGGIVSSPTLAMIGEGRESEAVIPLSKLSTMLDTGGGGRGDTIVFSPVINISGASSDPYADVKRGIDEGLNDFEKRYLRMKAQQHRLSYA